PGSGQSLITSTKSEKLNSVMVGTRRVKSGWQSYTFLYEVKRVRVYLHDASVGETVIKLSTKSSCHLDVERRKS
ncbi:MAG: hypothetical protein ACFFB7_08370, partial [Candidatus Sifarchaeia archaeon]